MPKQPEEKADASANCGLCLGGQGAGLCNTKRQLPGWPPQLSSCPYPAAVILTVESEEEEESDSSETEKEDDEGIIFVARATSEVLQEGKVSGNGFLPDSLPSGASWSYAVGISLFTHGLYSRQLPFPIHSFFINQHLLNIAFVSDS